MRVPLPMLPKGRPQIPLHTGVLTAGGVIVLLAAILAGTTMDVPAALVAALTIAVLDRFPIHLNPIGALPITGAITIPMLVLFGWPTAVAGSAAASALILLGRPRKDALNRGIERLLGLAAAAGAIEAIRFPGPYTEVGAVVIASFATTVVRTIIISLRMDAEEGIAWPRALHFMAAATFLHTVLLTAFAAAAVGIVMTSTSATDRLLVPVVAAAVTLQLYLPRILRGREERRVLAAVSVLAAAVDTKDPYTADHSTSVARLCQRVARHLGLEEPEVQQVYLAALLHDVGKTVVPPEILRKPGRLTPEEWAVMRGHVEAGARIVQSIRGLAGVAPIVAASHEWWDGAGYPRRLKGEEIPLGARILLAVDAYNALTTDRPYRPKRSSAAALQELDDHAGTQFDRRAVDALRAVLGEPRPRATPVGAPAWLTLLRQPAFGLLWVGEFVSTIGDNIFFIAVTLWVLKLTGSTTMLAVMLIAAPVGQILLGFFAGALADRVDRRSLIIATDIGRAALVAALPFVLLHSLPHSPLWGLGLLLLLSVGTVFFRSGILALIPSVAPREDLATANALFQTTQRIAEAIGSGLGGVLVVWVGYPMALYVDSASFFVSAVCVALMPVAWRIGLGTAAPKKIAAEIGEGLRYIWQTPVHRVLALLILPGYITLAFDALQAPMVVNTAGLSAVAYGVINGALALGKLLFAMVLTGTGKRWINVQFSVAMFILTSLATVFFGLTKLYPALIVAAFLFGVGNVATYIANTTISMANTPSHIIGRLMASRQVFIAATTVVGMLAFGWLADRAGPQAALIALGVVSAGGVFAVWLATERQLAIRAPAEVTGGEAE